MITSKIIRKGSKGLLGTIANAKHHAKPCLPLIELMTSMIESYGKDFDFVWEQGHNVHIIERQDGARLSFRPFFDREDWGIDVLAKFSRSQEIRLFTVLNLHEASVFGTFLGEFLSCPNNTYGANSEQ